MADSENLPHDATDRQGRRRPFATWVKKLTNFKGGSSAEDRQAQKRNVAQKRINKKGTKKNNPYPQSGQVADDAAHDASHQSFHTTQSAVASNGTCAGRDESIRSSDDTRATHLAGARSMAPTISTEHDMAPSLMAASHGASSIAGTSRTANGYMDSRRGGDSTFSSPAPSVRSLTTTLTTIQSLAANGGAPTSSNPTSHHAPSNSQVIQFNQPFPSTPASAIPPYLTPSGSNPGQAHGTGHPTTYSSATANNMLTDNASILTLASSSKRRRRRSLDTDASVRALAPSSVFGASRESLPLSVLSANIDGGASGLQHTTSRPGAERNSIYSATTGIMAAGERNSYYAKQNVLGGGGDGASVRSGLVGHGRTDSVNGSIGGMASPLASPREITVSEEDKELGNGEGVDKEEVSS